MIDLTRQVNILSDRIQPLRAGPSRCLVAIAGPPGSGKSTLAEELARRLNAQKCETAIVPQDGFHLDNEVLTARGDLGRKGAPHTFDGAGFVHLVRRLKERVDVAVPVFDRGRDIAIAGARIIPAGAEVVIVEGNYLLLDDAPWFNLAPLWALSVRLDVPLEDLRARLIQRWLARGFSSAAATRRAVNNDIPNARTVQDHALPPTLALSPDGTVTEDNARPA
ncbi:AAA family ATPase [Thalassorhabdomicrobium marinisediminis]|uniref:Sugar transporter n=1 Tax=Thalassorhabdomicrobium marinisediminis TaxID=2170577 RepID=A0A2T7G0I8_9RHOB|nr:AAA family ATPase [Thalassorhabdomicrobium marinisediminis]PVA07943.1 sugar transporter [Thalassorhabdomicrobium marinisediminis]